MNNVPVNRRRDAAISTQPRRRLRRDRPDAPIAGTLQLAATVDTAFDGVKMAAGSVLMDVLAGGNVGLRRRPHPDGPIEVNTT